MDEPPTPDPARSSTPTTPEKSDCELQADLDRKRNALGIVRAPSKPRLSRWWTETADPSPEDIARAERARWLAERQAKLDEAASLFAAIVASRGKRYESATFESFEAKSDAMRTAKATAEAYARNIREHVNSGHNVIFVGPRGTGKDHLAMSMARLACAELVRVKWVNGVDLFASFRDAMKQDRTEESIVERYAKTDVLWISDPAPPTGALTEYQQWNLFRLVDDRYSRMKPIWVTINAKGRAEIEQAIGAATYDRLRHGATCVSCNWESMREPAP